MGSYFKTVASAAKGAFSAVSDAAKVIGPATVEATKETVTKINEFSDKTNAKLNDMGLKFQSSADVPMDDEPQAEEKPDYSYPLALVALMSYVARSDENIAPEELALLNNTIDSFCSDPDMPREIKAKLEELADDSTLSFADVKEYLDAVNPEVLAALQKGVQAAASADGTITDEEKQVKDEFQSYCKARIVTPEEEVEVIECEATVIDPE